MKTSTRTEEQTGLIYGVLTCLTFAAYLVINRYVYVHYKVAPFNYTVTFLLSGGLFAATSLWLDKHKTPVMRSWHDVLPVIVNGILAGIAIGLLVFGQNYTTVVNASIISACTVLPTMLFSLFMLKERFTSRKGFWVAILLLGLYIAIVGWHWLNLNKGDLIIIGSVFLLGFTNTYAKVLMKQHDNSFLADVRLISGGLLFLVLGLVLNGTHLLVTTAGLWPLLAGFSFFVTIKMFYVAVHYLGPNEAVILTNNHPILTPIAGVFLLSEPYSLAKFVGSIIVIISVYFITRKN